LDLEKRKNEKHEGKKMKEAEKKKRENFERTEN